MTGRAIVPTTCTNRPSVASLISPVANGRGATFGPVPSGSTSAGLSTTRTSRPKPSSAQMARHAHLLARREAEVGGDADVDAAAAVLKGEAFIEGGGG